VQHLRYSSFLCAVVCATVLGATCASAQTVTKVDRDKVKINDNGRVLETNALYFVVDPDNKKKAIIRIDKIAGHTAEATILKGDAQAGWSLTLKKHASPATAGADKSSAATTYVSHSEQPSTARKPWQIDGFYETGTGKIASASMNEFPNYTAPSQSGTVSAIGLTFSYNLWLEEWFIFPEATYEYANTKQMGTTYSGANYDLGVGAGYLFDTFHVRVFADYKFLSKLAVSGGGVNFNWSGSAISLGAQGSFTDHWGAKVAYNIRKYGSMTFTDQGFSFSGAALSLPALELAITYGF
jgi:hypothetical protein